MEIFTEVVWECLWQRSSVPAKFVVYNSYDNPGTQAVHFTKIKQECMLHCEEHIPILEEAKQHASPADREYLQKLQGMSMFTVAELQRQAKRRMATGMDRLFARLHLVPAFILEIHLPAEEKRKLYVRTQERAKTRLIRISVTNLRESFLTLLRDPTTHPRIKVVILLLFTGRRTCEVLATGKFLPIPGRTYSCMFQGQVKNDGVEKQYIIPLLAPAEEIIAAVEQVRRQLEVELIGIGSDDKQRRAEINERFAGPLKKYLNRIIRPFTIQEMRPQDLRSLYVLLTYAVCDYTNYTLLPFSQSVLGHESVASTAHYHRFKATGLEAFSCPMDITAEDLGARGVDINV
jgi:hypothetical protein